MTGFQWFILAFIVILILGYWNWQRTSDQINRLSSDGFSISHDLGGVPKLLIDQTQQQFAVVQGGGYRLYHFNQIQRVDFEYESGSEEYDRFHIEINLQNASRNSEEIEYFSEMDGEAQLKLLETLIK